MINVRFSRHIWIGVFYNGNHEIISMPCAAQVIVAESYGGRDEPVDALVGNFVDVGLAPPFDALRVKGTPTEQTYQEYEESGTDLAQLLTQKVCCSL